MRCVVDCSFTSALFLPDEKSGMAHDFFARLKPSDILRVPLLWWYESANVLRVAVRRKRLTINDSLKILEMLDRLPIETDANCGADYAREGFNLSQLYNLSCYDAAYLELALRTNSRLMSLDDSLIKAAKDIGV
jgi:predicted nucleic acid-binding protein